MGSNGRGCDNSLANPSESMPLRRRDAMGSVPDYAKSAAFITATGARLRLGDLVGRRRPRPVTPEGAAHAGSFVTGPKGKHDTSRAAVRHGAGKGSVTLGGRRVPVERPRARTVDGHEVPLMSYEYFAVDDVLTQVVMERMLAGVATRRHARTVEPVGTQVDKEAKSTSRSAISRRFVKQTETALGELMARDLTGEALKVLMLDGEQMAQRCVVVALAINADGTKKPVGLRDGSTENKTVVGSLLADLVERGLRFAQAAQWLPTVVARRRLRSKAPRRARSQRVDYVQQRMGRRKWSRRYRLTTRPSRSGWARGLKPAGKSWGSRRASSVTSAVRTGPTSTNSRTVAKTLRSAPWPG
jgi:hypothetical protein